MNLQTHTDTLVKIVGGFNLPLATELAKAIGAERSSSYYTRRDLMARVKKLEGEDPKGDE